jgi:hypothetical protein
MAASWMLLFAVAVDNGNSFVTGGTSSNAFLATNDTKWMNCHSGFLDILYSGQ